MISGKVCVFVGQVKNLTQKRDTFILFMNKANPILCKLPVDTGFRRYGEGRWVGYNPTATEKYIRLNCFSWFSFWVY